MTNTAPYGVLMEVPFLLFLVCQATTILSALGGGLVRWIALRRSILDVPTDRSMHEVPMPRGGGAAMAVVSMVALIFLHLARPELLSARWMIAVVGGGIATAVIGWLDDCYSLGAGRRFLVHIAAGAWACWWLVPTGSPIWMSLFGVFWIAWAINFFNFMDGIDGLAGGEAVMVGLTGGYLAGRLGLLAPQSIAWVTAAAALGFLFWNWPPAKLFMGDAGSGYLGYVFGCLCIGSGMSFQGGFGTWALLLAMFWIDTTVTLLRRILKGERFWEAHRQHFYQRAVQNGFSHLEVVWFYSVGNLLLSILTFYLTRTW
ncbi:MAG TPA: glycosyltransferase family 4 protein [Candidatus Ozemobacteraceae bacterium]|nr:glycosyltransferase family 4 protein [Candidatus Ozemobacteraceae bacterium]